MKTPTIALAALAALAILASPALAQEFSFDEFVGTWEGTISSGQFGGYDEPITLVVHADGSYTDSSGRLMPTIYPDTQMCEYDVPTNRVHFWYLQTVYAGQRFYQHHYHEVVEYTGNYLELHYNFWDDDQPNPEAQTIALFRAGVTAAGGTTPVIATSTQAYPNPFNPATRVVFELTADGPARLTTSPGLRRVSGAGYSRGQESHWLKGCISPTKAVQSPPRRHPAWARAGPGWT